MGDGTSAAAAAAHCVWSEEFVVVLEKNVDPGRRTRWSVQRSGCLFSLVSVICTLAWQLDPDDTIN